MTTFDEEIKAGTFTDQRTDLRRIADALHEGFIQWDSFDGSTYTVVTALNSIAIALQHVARAIEGKVEEPE